MRVPVADLKKRLVIVGDVHGCLDELQALMKKVDYDPQTTSVVMVGDLMVKGPKNIETLRWIRSQNIMSVRGNHEDNILLAYQDRQHKYAKRKVYKFVESLTQDDFEFVKNLPVSLTIPELDLSIVHAGIDPTRSDKDVHHQEFKHLIRMRCIDKQGNPTKEGPNQDGNYLWGPLHKTKPYVVFGHDAKRGVQSCPFAKGLDSGCVYGKKLTALLIEDVNSPQQWWDRATFVSVEAFNAYASPDDED